MTADFVVVGGGIIGLCVARSLKRRNPSAKVVLLEKEAALGAHASGRNSGVLHAGFYYTADSLKARFTRDGRSYWDSFCTEHQLPINRCGKLVVAQSEADLAGLDELSRRAQVNGVRLEPVDELQMKQIEPSAKTFERALWSPDTATVSPQLVIQKVRELAETEGVEIRTGCAFEGRTQSGILAGGQEISCGYLVNCAGLYADKIAKQYGFSEHLEVLPFKGLYLYSEEPAGQLRTNIYPVPNLKNPFLGVHFTVTADGHCKIGPTAIPALWRENYCGFAGFQAGEFLRVATLEAGLFFKAGFDFRSLALEEAKKYWRPYMVGLAQALREGVKVADYRKWGKPGIRAQLIDRRTSRLIMDFMGEGDERSYHVLNAVSPGFTCAAPFAEHVVDEAERLMGSSERIADAAAIVK